MTTSTDPLDMPLPCDVRFPGVTFGKGVALRTLVNAATRWKARADEAFAAKVPPDAKEQFSRLMEDLDGR
jgi:aconitase B